MRNTEEMPVLTSQVEQTVSREAWLKLPWLKRLVVVLFCDHPITQSLGIGKVLHGPRGIKDMNYAINVMQCGVCGQYFIDDGFEFKKQD